MREGEGCGRRSGGGEEAFLDGGGWIWGGLDWGRAGIGSGRLWMSIVSGKIVWGGGREEGVEGSKTKDDMNFICVKSFK